MDPSPQSVSHLQAEWQLVFQQGALLSMFPIEKWLAALDRADAIAPIVDPTLYRDYISGGRDELIRGVLEGALAFKRAVLKAQEMIKANPALGEPHPKYREVPACR